MFKRILLGCLIVVGWMLVPSLLFMPMPVAAFTVPETHCIDAGCDDAPSGGGGGDDGGSSYDYEDEDIERKNKKIRNYNDIHQQYLNAYDRGDYREALRLLYEQQKLIDGPNVREGIAYLENYIAGKDYDQQADAAKAKGDYKQALEFYKKALAKFPNSSPEYRKFVADYERDVARQGKIAKTFDRLSDAVKDNRPAPSIPGLQFGSNEAGDDSANGSSELEFMAESGNEQSGRKDSTANAGSQLKSVEWHGGVAKTLNGPAGKGESAMGFDTPGKNNGTLAYPDKNNGAPSALASRIPKEVLDKVMKDGQFRQSFAYYQKLEALNTEIAGKITAINEKQKNGDGDPVVLAAQLATLKNQQNLNAKDQANAEKDIKEKLITIHFDLDGPASTNNADTKRGPNK